MNWPGALQKTGVHSRLETVGKDVQAVKVYTHMFVLGKPGERVDDREDPFYTATGATPQEAEAAAHLAYLRATACQHCMVRKNPTLLECAACGIQQRTALAHQPLHVATKSGTKPAKPERRLFGLFRAS